MYSAKINGQATTFGTSGMLYRSNKLMYDRTTNSIWNQFTGEPVIGPLARAGIKLPFFPVNLTTWGEWLEEHPDTTVISNDTGIYPPETYLPESDPQAIYNSYFTSPRTMFPVTDRNDRLETKAVVLGLGIGESFKAYPVAALQVERVVNDTLGGTEVVVIGAASSQAARAYERDGRRFSISEAEAARDGLPRTLTDSEGGSWTVSEEFLTNQAAPSQQLRRLPTHMAFWFGWYAFHGDTEVYGQEGG